jgi:integrase/recombinase XerC
MSHESALSPAAAAPPTIVEQRIAGFLLNLRGRNLSVNTIDSYRKDLAGFAEYVGPAEWREIDHTLIRSYLGHLYDRGLSKASAARALSALRSLYKWMASEGLVEQNPAALIRSPKLPKKLPRVPTIEEMNRLLDGAMPERDAFPERDRAMLELLYGSGIRNSELAGLDLLDIRWESDSMLVRGKGSKERLVPLGGAAAQAIRGYLPRREEILACRRKDTAALLVNLRGTRLTTRSIRRIVKTLAVAGGLSADVHPHTLRHAFGTHLLEEGAGLRDIQEMMGHGRLSTTQRYTQLSSKKLREVYTHTHPHAGISTENRD